MSLLLVAPYEDLVVTAQSSLAAIDYPIEIIQGDLSEGVRKAEHFIAANGIEGIISRGGTATLLKKSLSLPVFEIYVTGYDLLRAIYPHVLQKKKMAVVGYENVISGAKSIAQTLSIDLGYYLLTGTQKIEDIMREAQQSQVELIIGDAVSVQTAKEFGLDYELIISGPEAILSATDAAIDFVEHMQSEILRNKRLNLIMEHASQGIIYLNAQDEVELINSKAQLTFAHSKARMIGKKLSSEMVPQSLVDMVSTGLTNQLVTIGGKDYMFELLHIFTDNTKAATLLFMQSSGRIKDLEETLTKQMALRGLVAKHTFDDMIATNITFIKTIERAKRFSQTNSTILLIGETGVGKEMFAQSIHNNSDRKDGPFVAVNCAALPENLLESELFGYVEGAFTGAKKGGKAGLFEMAHKGSIFLDEVNDMSANVQARLLRVLQEKQVMRIGDDRVHTVDVRFIAACNKDLYEEAQKGNFRMDLYYRLRVLDITIPPLRARKEDIIPLFFSFTDYFATKYGYQKKDISPYMQMRLEEAGWPGNIRQLRNYAEKVSVLLSMDVDLAIIEDDLIQELTEREENINHFEQEQLISVPRDASLKEMEAMLIKSVWEAYEQNISKAAKQLGIDRSTVRKYI